MNVISKQPVVAEHQLRLERGAGDTRSSVGKLLESEKAKVRRLAAHCRNYRGSIPKQAISQLLTTLVPLFALLAGMFAAVQTHYWITLLLALPAAGLVVRAFIIQHDCGHGSFLASRRWNDIIGKCMSLITLVPYGLWRREHAHHHASSGNLDRRGAGDITTLTVREYQQLSTLQKLRYRIYRSSYFLFGIGVPAYFMFLQRTPWLHALKPRDCWKSVLGLNVALVAFYGGLIYLFGWSHVLWVMLPIVHISSAAGGWLFFIQHQFEEAHWEHADNWDFQVAALLGSSFYDLPRVLNWFTGNIGLHHIHHLNSMIPNYRLQDCLQGSPELRSINHMTLKESLKCARLKLWDEDSKRLIGFSDLASPAAA